MSWLCLFTLSCLANPTTSMTMPTSPDVDTTLVATQVRPTSRNDKSSAHRPSISSQTLRCELRHVRRDGAQMMLAVVRADMPIVGAYEFRVGTLDTRSTNLSSSTGDEFQIRAGERLELEGPSIDLGRNTPLTARLELRDEQGKLLTDCHL